MEKMNQVSVIEFMSKSKEEMYDMAVEMVEKYNRLVDICNDGAERIADLVIERDNLSKGVQKLIGERDELIERHKVYTNALNKDIADKAAKIELLEKEIEGRKEGYWALKEKMDTQYISIDDHNDVCEAYKKKVVELKKESEKWQDLAKMNRDTICNQYDVCEDFKKKITELKEENEKLKVDLIHEREKNEKLAKDHAELENDMRRVSKERDSYAEKVNDLRLFNAIDMELFNRLNLNGRKKGEDDHGRAGFKEYIKWLVKEEETKYKESWKARLNEELEAIFKEEEETEVKGRYPWGSKVRCKKPDGIYCSYSDECHRKPENFNCDFKDDIPCGSDSIE